MEWISTKDRMPDLEKWVLCYLTTRFNDIGYEYRTLKLCKDNNCFYFSDISSSWPDFSVKFWAELPAPPKGEE